MGDLRIDRLTLENFRGFESLEIEFSKKGNLTVLVGANGAGKTALLDAVAIAITPYLRAFDDLRSPGRLFVKNDIHRFQARETDSDEMETAEGGVRLVAEGRITGGENISWEMKLAGAGKRTTTGGSRALESYGAAMQTAMRRSKPPPETLPLIVCYDTGRLWRKIKLTAGKADLTSRAVAYIDALAVGSSYRLLEDWMKYWTESSLQKARRAKNPNQNSEFDIYLSAVRKAVDICLKPSGWEKFDYDIGHGGLIASHREHGEMMFDQLSDGVRNTMAMVGDIAFRATKLNPHLGIDAAAETPGIALIDEVDMHLHPGWQQMILGGLLAAFPKIQFIVTTHSPQVLTTVANDAIRIIHPDGVLTPGQQTEGWASSSVMASVMSVSQTPDNDPARWLSRYKTLVVQDLEEYKEGQALWKKIIKHFGDDHPEVEECQHDIRVRNIKKEYSKKSKSN